MLTLGNLGGVILPTCSHESLFIHTSFIENTTKNNIIHNILALHMTLFTIHIGIKFLPTKIRWGGPCHMLNTDWNTTTQSNDFTFVVKKIEYLWAVPSEGWTVSRVKREGGSGGYEEMPQLESSKLFVTIQKAPVLGLKTSTTPT